MQIERGGGYHLLGVLLTMSFACQSGSDGQPQATLSTGGDSSGGAQSSTGEPTTDAPTSGGPGGSPTSDATTGDVTTGDVTTDPGSASSDSTTTTGTAASDPFEGCGDGVVGPDEECDDGGANGPNAACTPKCKVNVCGDAYDGPGEECDLGTNNGDDKPCTSGCKLAACGDGLVGPTEQCDDGNDVQTDACTNACKLPICGDGILSKPIEQCEDGNSEDDDGCSSDCQLEIPVTCGDGYLDPGEECDDFQDGDPDDGCTDKCKFPVCGDGLVSPSLGEQCDDGNADNTDKCIDTCKLGKCGDGYIMDTMEQSEWCDDGNQSYDDFCNPSCTTPKRVFVTSTTYDGNLGNDEGARAKCQERANAAGLGGTWDAWLSSNHEATFKLGIMGHVARLDKVSIAHGNTSVYGPNLLAPINVTEMGEVLADVEVWTHTTASGNRDWANDDTMGCLSFTSNHPNRQAGYGTTAATDKLRTQAGVASCAEFKHLYCFDLEYYKP
ncbi:DUF4215 domain-containing protein [Nannocystis pusilla]|uniref:DUF4215 domain-containing protein n=2 Tax=Nannocystis pusilla TaxID=889268 RepID=A0ABS7U612_9BACT|nr:DUF4215 domain-containing protein [Nannocystis pusilla]